MNWGTCISPRYGPTMKTNSTLSGCGTVLNMSNRCSREVFPATLTNGFGLLQVWGRMRVPQPAIGMKILRVSFMLQFYRVKRTRARDRVTFRNGPGPDVAGT